MRDSNEQQKQDQEQHQQYLITNPMSPEAYKYREQLWHSFFNKEAQDGNMDRTS